jgi:hypothetical protein
VGFLAFKAWNSIESRNNKIPTLLEDANGLFKEFFVIPRQCGDRRILTNGASVGGALGLNIIHGFYEGFFSCCIANAPPCHGKAFGNTINGQRPFF